MILSLLDRTEAVYLTLILWAAHEGKPLEEMVRLLHGKASVPTHLKEIRRFLRSTLRRPDMKRVLEGMDIKLGRFHANGRDRGIATQGAGELYV